MFQKRDEGSVLLEKCFFHLDIIEKDYFGLQYTDHNNVSVSCQHFILACSCEVLINVAER